MPFDINTLPKPPPKIRLAPGVVKKDAPSTRRALKRDMLANIARESHGLEDRVRRLGLTKEEAERRLQENAYDNFLKRQLFKFASWPHRYYDKTAQESRKFVDEYDKRHSLDFANADKYAEAWRKLSPAEKDQVIAASGKPDYKFPKKLGQYLPSILPKTAVKDPEMNYSFYGNASDNRKASKLSMLNLLKNKQKDLERRIATPSKYMYPETPGNLMPEKEADKERRQLERDIFKDRIMFKLGRGHDERYGENPRNKVITFSRLWDAMPASEKDEYIAQSKVGITPAIAAKKYGIPSIISELPEPKKPAFAGVKKTTEGSRHFEKQKMLSDVQKKDEALRRQIRDQKLSAEKAAPLVKENEYESFLKKKLFKFSDPSLETARKINPLAPFDYNVEYGKELNKRFPGGYTGAVGPNWQNNVAQYKAIDPYIKANEARAAQEYEAALQKIKDPRARQDVASAKQYESIWNQLTENEKNQVMQASNYTPKGIEYYMAPEPPVAAPIFEQKVAMEPEAQQSVAAPANLFPAPISREVQMEEARRMKMERDAMKVAKEQLERWKSVSPAEKQQILYNQQAIGHLGQQQQTEYQRQQQAIQQREAELGIPFQQGMGISPIMMNELMSYMESQPTRHIPVRPRRSINEKIMSNFDPNLFSPEFISEES